MGWRAATILSASLGLAACAGSVPPPTAQLGASAQAIQQAERAGALEHAPAEFQSAREKLAAADAAMREDERTKARRLAEQAQADAELATVRSQRATAQQAASAVRTLANPKAGMPGAPLPGRAPAASAAAPLAPSGMSGTSTWDSPRTLEGTP
ncbi:hypothetical protein ABAZ39_12900 [Azospirillum argentinense]|uniref:DUF4398 domain-containing protein n=1 Tax=Azospirillum argentinense TaxID=2970906 RepID=A0A060DJA8_9PROT|nr:DUF4398 domain-containing protein [Azospirillum argentinense]AIB12870.1 hypothetical protein ABAZ39_12900 [Azospirillum argentinense]EZQ09625.1 hypothetical protein ABAZ39_14305 [Azospirillum argentinense]PNQ97631.1 DUF4398 domain-containing protein [Azospirillum argentinense]